MANEHDYPRGRYDRGDYSGRTEEESYNRGDRGDRDRNYGGYYSDPYRSYGGSYNDPYYRGSGYGNSGNYSNEPYRSSRYNESYSNEPSGRYDYGRSNYGSSYGGGYSSGYGGGYGSGYGSSYGGGYGDYGSRYGGQYGGQGRQGYWNEGRYNEPYNRGWSERDDRDRGFLERAGDEVRSWFGDEEAERRRQMDQARSGHHAGRGPKGYRRSDERIREDINERLTEDPYLDATNIEVTVDATVVTLSGAVEDRNDKRRAESLAESVRGVTDVNNQIRVSPSTSQTETTTMTGANRSRAART